LALPAVPRRLAALERDNDALRRRRVAALEAARARDERAARGAPAPAALAALAAPRRAAAPRIAPARAAAAADDDEDGAAAAGNRKRPRSAAVNEKTCVHVFDFPSLPPARAFRTQRARLASIATAAASSLTPCRQRAP